MAQAMMHSKKKVVKRTYIKRDHEFWARGIKKKAARVAATKRGKAAIQLFTPPATRVASQPKVLNSYEIRNSTTRRREVTITVHMVEFSEG